MATKKTIFRTFLAALVLVLVNSAAAQTSARVIVKRYQDNMELKGYESIARLLIYDKKGRLRERKVAMIGAMSQDGTINNSLMRFLAPADVKGTGFLTRDYKDKDDEMWIFLPSLRKSRRIVSSEKSGNFLGSELTFADMSQFSLDDFNFKLNGTESVSGTKCHVITQTPINKKIANEYNIGKRILYIGKEDYVIRKSIAWNKENKKWKEFSVLDIRPIPKLPEHSRAFHIQVVNLLNGRKSEFILDKFEYNPNVKNDFFTIAYLERQ